MLLILLYGIGALAALFTLVFTIMILIHAFKKSTTYGLLTLLVPCYIFYYVFVHYKKDATIGKKWLLWLLGVIVMLIFYVGASIYAVKVAKDILTDPALQKDAQKQIEDVLKK